MNHTCLRSFAGRYVFSEVEDLFDMDSNTILEASMRFGSVREDRLPRTVSRMVVRAIHREYPFNRGVR